MADFAHRLLKYGYIAVALAFAVISMLSAANMLRDWSELTVGNEIFPPAKTSFVALLLAEIVLYAVAAFVIAVRSWKGDTRPRWMWLAFLVVIFSGIVQEVVYIVFSYNMTNEFGLVYQGAAITLLGANVAFLPVMVLAFCSLAIHLATQKPGAI